MDNDHMTSLFSLEKMDGYVEQNKHVSSAVLVVDDDLAIRKGLAFILQKEGYTTIEAKNGREAIEIVNSQCIDIILLDLMMPELNGLEVCSQLKNNEETRLIPVVMITAIHEQKEKLKAIDAGVDDFITKPINIPELRARVRSLLRMKHLNDLLDRADTVISSLANAIEAKDKYTEGHNERVSRYARELAKAIDLSEREQEIISMAGILHDIGKIGVPDNILNKKGPLDDLEFACIVSHPQHGEKILKPLHSLHGVHDVVLYHHEHWDGNGYPFGLKSEEIPLYARIIAIADSYDAMISTRPYRKALKKSAALKELEDKAGQIWDPNLVKIFLNLMQTNEESEVIRTDNEGENSEC